MFILVCKLHFFVCVYIGQIQSKELTPGQDQMLRSLSAAVARCPLDHIKNHQLPAKLVAGDNTFLPDNMQTLMNHVCGLLLHHERALQMAAFKILKGYV